MLYQHNTENRVLLYSQLISIKQSQILSEIFHYLYTKVCLDKFSIECHKFIYHLHFFNQV